MTCNNRIVLVKAETNLIIIPIQYIQGNYTTNKLIGMNHK